MTFLVIKYSHCHYYDFHVLYPRFFGSVSLFHTFESLSDIPGLELMNESEIEAAVAAMELEDQLLQPEWSYLVLSVVPLVCILGSVMVVAAVWTTRSLQTPTNHLLVELNLVSDRKQKFSFQVSLAMADLIVGAFVMPFSIYLSVNTNNLIA